MRIVLDESIPRELAHEFSDGTHRVDHVDDLGLKGARNGDLLAAIAGDADIFITGDTNLGYQQNLRRFDLAIILIHPRLLVVEQIRALIPATIAAFASAARSEVTVIGEPVRRRR